MKLNFYKDLTKEQRRRYGNECGPDWFGIDKLIPEFEWGMACREHDFYYDCGGNSSERDWADTNFRERMYKQLNKHGNWWQKIVLRPVIEIYYLAVRIGGKDAFDYGPYLTLEELIKKANKKYGIEL